MRQKLHLSITARAGLSDVASPATSEERNEKGEQGSQQQGFQRTEKMWTKCQRFTAAMS